MGFATQLKDLDRELGRFHGRLKVGAVLVALLAAALLARGFYLQVVQHEHYIQRAESNRISRVPTAPNRGLILDRNDRILAENYSAYTLELTRAQTHNLEATPAEAGRPHQRPRPEAPARGQPRAELQGQCLHRQDRAGTELRIPAARPHRVRPDGDRRQRPRGGAVVAGGAGDGEDVAPTP